MMKFSYAAQRTDFSVKQTEFILNQTESQTASDSYFY